MVLFTSPVPKRWGLSLQNSSIKKLSCLLFAVTCSFGVVVCPAADSSSEQGAYIGLFGGFGSASSTSLRQEGGFYLPTPAKHRIGVDANGDTDRQQLDLGGIQVGYEWRRQTPGQSKWGLKTGVELEGIYIGKHSPVGDLPIEPSVLGTQFVTIPMSAGVQLANAVFTLDTPYFKKTSPYLAVGVGMAIVSIKGSNSTNPNEPGVNHFDSDPDASDSAFAMQFKAGLKRELTEKLFLFAEYRYLFINSTRYTFGETLPPHFRTDDWEVSLGRQSHNLFVAGLQYKF